MWRARFWRRTAQDSCALGAAGAWASGSLPLSPKCSPAPREIAKRKVFRNLQYAKTILDLCSRIHGSDREEPTLD